MEGYNIYYYNVDSVFILMTQSITEDLKDTIEDLDTNIKLLKSAEEINSNDTKTLFIQIFELLKDVLQRFKTVFTQVEEIMDIKQSTEKGESYIDGKELNNQDIKNLYL